MIAVLGLGVTGCGTMSRRSDSMLLATASPSVLTSQAPDAPMAVAPVAQAAPEVVAGASVELTPAAEMPADVVAPESAPEPALPLVAAAPSATDADTLLAQATAPKESDSAAREPDELREYDPWEPFNEKMFTFNYNMDKYVLKPVAKGYDWVMPDELQRMIDNGFHNVNPVPRWVNNLLQLNFKGFGVEMSRFLINSTLGIGGLFDIAKQEFGLERTRVDFGQTLGKWGVRAGPYLVLPFLPPMTVRDGIGYGVDGAMNPLSYFIPFIWDRLLMKIGETINDRSLNLELFQGFEESTVDLYSAVRNGYLQRRYNLIHQDQK